MGINLQKGQRIDLTKGNAALSKIMVGLGWDSVSQSSNSGFLGSLFGSSKAAEIDCDASVIMLQNDRFMEKDDLVYFGNKQSRCGAIIHSGDNLTGEGDGDDETIIIDLKAIPERFNKLIFVVNIYDCVNRRQDFGMIHNAFIRIVNPVTNQEMLRYNLTDNYRGLTTLIIGEIYRYNSEWRFAAIGDGTTDCNLSEIVRRYQ